MNYFIKCIFYNLRLANKINLLYFIRWIINSKFLISNCLLSFILFSIYICTKTKTLNRTELNLYFVQLFHLTRVDCDRKCCKCNDAVMFRVMIMRMLLLLLLLMFCNRLRQICCVITHTICQLVFEFLLHTKNNTHFPSPKI